MLDGILAFWVALAFLCVLLDRRWIERKTEQALAIVRLQEQEEPLSFGPGAMAVEEPLDQPAPTRRRRAWVPSPLWRPWRFAAGLACGAAAAVKWSGFFAIIGVGLLSLFWERTRRKDAGVHNPLGTTIVHEAFGMILALLVVPLAVYLVSYTGFFIERGFSWQEFWDRQTGIYGFHAGDNQLKAIKPDGTASHPYLSAWYTWLLLLRPVAYFFKGPGQEILGVGNPVIFWTSLFAIPYGFLKWTVGRDWRAGFAFTAVAVQLLPWVYFSRPQFLFYMAPVSPFLVLAVTYACWSWSRTRDDGTTPWTAVVAALVVSLSVAVFVFHWPVLSAWPLTREAWHIRMWVDCGEALKPFGCGWV
jgi:dolichyl-phosphate-mannose--protein O-mannosyl transferase